MRRLVTGVGLLMLLAGLAGRADAQTPSAAGQVSDASARIIRPGDVLRVRIWPDPEHDLSGEFPVEESGLIYLPLLGEVWAGGATLEEIRSRLRQGYEQAIKSSVVTVVPLFTVSILGAVVRPGLYRIDPTQVLFDVVSLAGGFTSGAKLEEVRVIRDGRVLEINAEQALATGAPLLVMALRSEDRIIVPERRQGFLTFGRVGSLLQGAISVVTVIELMRR